MDRRFYLVFNMVPRNNYCTVQNTRISLYFSSSLPQKRECSPKGVNIVRVRICVCIGGRIRHVLTPFGTAPTFWGQNYLGLGSFLSESFFSRISKVWKYLDICIKIRRRSVTFRENLQKQKNKVCSISHIWKKRSEKPGRLKICAKKTWKLWGKSSPLKMTLEWTIFFRYKVKKRMSR